MELRVSNSLSKAESTFCLNNLSYILNCLGPEGQMVREFVNLHFSGKPRIEMFINNVRWYLEVRPYETAKTLVSEGAPKFAFCFVLVWDGVEYLDYDVDDRDVNPYGIVVNHGLRLLRDNVDDIILSDFSIDFARSHGGLCVRFTDERRLLKQQFDAKQTRSNAPVGKMSLLPGGSNGEAEPFEVILRRCLETGKIVRTTAILICSGMDAFTIEAVTQYPLKKSVDLMRLYMMMNP